MEIKIKEAPRSGRTASGYSSRSATRYMVQLVAGDLWRRLYCVCYSNCASHYVNTAKGRVFIPDADLPFVGGSHE